MRSRRQPDGLPFLLAAPGREPASLAQVEKPVIRQHDEVFLLGAGFARAISPTMPLLQDLAARIEAALGRSARIPPEVRAMMADNFAHALSYLEQAKPWVTEADNLRHRALYLDMSNAIARVLDRIVAEVGEKLSRRVPDWLGDLVGYWHEHRCTVLTLNYDTLIESLAANVELPAGERIHSADIYPLVLTDAGLRSGRATAERRLRSFRLLKLHGSTNWYYSGRAPAHGEPIYFVPPPGFGDVSADEREQHALSLRAVADKYPFLVPPVYDKSPLLTHETIQALWFEAGDALKHARRVICMGYSLPDSDLTMMHFLRTTCGPRAELEVVNQTREALQNFERRFRGTRVRVRQTMAGSESIAQFVSRLGRPPRPRSRRRRSR